MHTFRSRRAQPSASATTARGGPAIPAVTVLRGTIPTPTPAATIRHTASKLRTWMRTSTCRPSAAAAFMVKVWIAEPAWSITKG